jgi:activator of 2-hydroxyglutaryl-CoA dehydratase
MYTAGIDIGSISTKAVIMEDGRVLASRVIFTGYNAEAAGRKVFEMVLADTNLAPPDIRRIIATGRRPLSESGDPFRHRYRRSGQQGHPAG